MSILYSGEDTLMAQHLMNQSQLQFGIVEQVLPRNEFLERYTDVLALGETALTVRRPISIDGVHVLLLDVIPWNPAILALYEKTTGDLSTRPREEAEQMVREQIAEEQRTDRYRNAGRLSRKIEVVKCIFNRPSDYTPSMFRRNKVPHIIKSHMFLGNIVDVLVDECLAEKLQAGQG